MFPSGGDAGSLQAEDAERSRASVGGSSDAFINRTVQPRASASSLPHAPRSFDSFLPAGSGSMLSASATPFTDSSSHLFSSFAASTKDWPTQALHRALSSSSSSSALRPPPGFSAPPLGEALLQSSPAPAASSSGSAALSSSSSFFTRSVSSPASNPGDGLTSLSAAISSAFPSSFSGAGSSKVAVDTGAGEGANGASPTSAGSGSLYHLPFSPIILGPHEPASIAPLAHPMLSSRSPALPEGAALSSASLFTGASSGASIGPGAAPHPQLAAYYRHSSASLPSPPAFSAARPLPLPRSSSPTGFGQLSARPPALADDEDDEYYLAIARRNKAHSAGAGASSSSSFHTSSPGQGIRRLAESFLDSIGDEGDREGSRDYDRGGLLEGLERKRREVEEMLHMMTMSRRNDQQPMGLDTSPHSFASTNSSVSSPSLSRPSSNPAADHWACLHNEILQFAQTCQQLQQQQSALRDDLSQRTRRAVKSVWPTAEVDLVGSVSAGVALPKSDLDFVVYFGLARESDPRPAYTYSAPLNEDGHASLDAVALSKQQAEAHEQSSSPSSISPPPPVSSPASSSPSLVHHFAHAGSLIKLLGGRKKSKLLFRSTKIQVFKDINLIRLRDGCSGISMDLWFPTSSFITLRSQQHTHLITSFLNTFPFFYPLSVVVKSFMQQQMLNSGYSGLGSYGVLLMIVRFLQVQRDQSRKKDRDQDATAKETTELPALDGAKERTSSASSTSSTASSSSSVGSEGNLGRTLCEFFRFYCTFDYANKAIDVRGEGSFFDKPELSAIVKKGKAQGPGGPPAGDDDEEADGNSEDDQADKGDASEWSGTGGAGDVDPSFFTQYTLVIRDPQDPSNLIVGHHRALRNMVQAFMKALTVLDADSPLPSPPAALMTPLPAPATSQAHTMTASLAATTTAAMFHSQYALPPSSGMGRTTSDIVYPSALITLPSHFPASAAVPGPSTAPGSGGLTAFQRLLDVHAAYAGPAMKECPNMSCRSLHPPTLCPIQNKVCFTCGYMFVKAGGAHIKHGHHANRAGGAGKKKMQGGSGGMQNGAAAAGGLGHRMRMGGSGGHLQQMNMINTQQQQAGQMRSEHPKFGVFHQQQKKFSRSGFHTEPSSPTYSYQQPVYPKSSPSPPASFLGAQSGGGYLQHSPPQSSPVSGGMANMSAQQLSEPRMPSPSSHLAVASHQMPFARTQSHPVSQMYQQQQQAAGMQMGKAAQQPYRGALGPPPPSDFRRSQSSSAHVGRGGGNHAGRRGGGGPSTSPPASTQRFVHHYGAQQGGSNFPQQQQQQQQQHYADYHSSPFPQLSPHQPPQSHYSYSSQPNPSSYNLQ